MAEWFEDDELWRVLTPVLFGPAIVAKAPAQVEAICALLQLGPGARLLDLPCGVGRHTVEFARRGHRVTGVDRTRGYLERARATVAEAGLDAEIVQGDMRSFRRPGEFDVVMNMWTSFGYSEDPRDDHLILGNFFASLKPGGRLFMELNGREVLTRSFRERDWHRLEDGTLFLEERAVADDWTRIDNRWTVVRDGAPTEVRFSLRVYSASELKSLAAAAGFGDIRCFGSLAGTPYDHKAERLVMVATRPA